jgi:hypothetical protein
MTELDRIPLDQIETRYQIGRTARDTRLRAAGITPIRVGRSPFIDSEQLKLLDLQHQHLIAGGTLESFKQEFLTLTDTSATIIPILNQPDKYDTDFSIPILEMEAIRRNALDAIASNERIQTYAILEIHAKLGETLTDSEIKELIGFKPPRTGFKYERYKFIRYSKIYMPGADGKLVKESTWSIEKFDPLLKSEVRSQRSEVLSLEDFDRTYQEVKEVLASC